MPRLAILNFIIGFAVLFLAASGGSFVAFDMTEGYLRDPELLHTWQMALLKSSHGHTNLFAMLHILFGLTLAYSPLPHKYKVYQTIGFFTGCLAMGPGMMARAYAGPSESLDPLGILIGIGLSGTLVALLLHCCALAYKLKER
ncbi:MAG: hypothetical protein HRU19_29735 [Pseudobacteriovorax sp.]|nr:hypothetical protein [Pseudobacteriovorax sp.]